MTTWTVILFAVALVWVLLLAVISVIFADKERNEREDLQKQKETLRYLEDKAEQRLKQREAEIEDQTNSLHRAKEAFRKEEARLAEKAESLLEFEAALDKFEAALNEKEEKVTKAKKEGKK